MSPINNSFDVMANDLCIGCGACTVNTKHSMIFDQDGFYKPSRIDQSLNSSVCPFVDSNHNEDSLSAEFTEGQQHVERLGNIVSLYCGHVTDQFIRRNSTSGGMGTWITLSMFNSGLIDRVIHVRPTHSPEHPYFEYSISRSTSDINFASGSRYYPINFRDVMQEVIDDPEEHSYCFVGIPCFVKAMRLLQLEYPVLRKKIKFTVAIVCGHMKSSFWTEMLAWSAGITPGNLAEFRHRTKLESPDFEIRKYLFTAKSVNGKSILKDSAEVPGGKFNSGAFMANACNFCDDVVGETADITLGDAWLPRYETDNKGNNLIIVRNYMINELLDAGRRNNELNIETCTSDDALWAQAGGFRQRGEGLAYRLYLRTKQNLAVPTKRFKPSRNVPLIRKIIYRLRMRISTISITYYKRARAKRMLKIYLDKLLLECRVLRVFEIYSSFFRIVVRRVGWIANKLR